MSRCYPYQPTVSVRNGASGEPRIGTIKLHYESKKSKTESLIEKKGRKEKRKERKEKEKHYDFCDGKVKKLRHEKCYQDEKNGGLLVGYLSKESKDEEAERLDKSDLTDEHDEPVCYLSDGAQSCKKRKRQPSTCVPSAVPSTTASITVHNNIIRIKLTSQKCSETDASLSNRQSCSTSGRGANSIAQTKQSLQVQDQKHCGIADNNAGPIPDFVKKEGILQIGGKSTANGNTLYENKLEESIAPVDCKPAANRNALYESKVQSTKSFYKSLIEDWVPPPFQSVLDEADDEEWLFWTKQQSQELKRLKAGNDFSDVVSCRQNSTMWPCTRRLPEADIYALPYTLPY